MKVVTWATSKKKKYTEKLLSYIFLKTPTSFQIATSFLIESNMKLVECRWFWNTRTFLSFQTIQCLKKNMAKAKFQLKFCDW